MEYEKPSLFQRIFCNKKMLSVHINNFISRYNIFSFATQSVLSKDQKYHHLKLARNADYGALKHTPLIRTWILTRSSGDSYVYQSLKSTYQQRKKKNREE